MHMKRDLSETIYQKNKIGLAKVIYTLVFNILRSSK